MRAFLPCLMMMAFFISDAACADPRPDVLFSVRDYTKSGITYSGAGQNIRILIEPIAFIVDGKLAKIPETPDQQQFGQDYYANQQPYVLYAGGNPAGKVKVLRSAFGIQCFSMAAEARVSPSAAVGGMRMALASNHPFAPSGYTRRAATPGESAFIQGVASNLYRTQKLSQYALKHVRASSISVFEGKGNAILAASFTVVEDVKAGRDILSTTHAAFLVAERIGNRPYKTTLSWFHTGAEAEVERQDLVDIIDTDGDGFPEIITQSAYYESVEYHVYRKRGSAWEDSFESPRV